MKIEYEYASEKMVLKLESNESGFVLNHFQYSGNPEAAVTKLFGTVKYKSKLSCAELLSLREALLRRDYDSRVEIGKKMYVIRPKEKNSMMALKFPNALESVPIPRDVSDALAGLIHDATHS